MALIDELRPKEMLSGKAAFKQKLDHQVAKFAEKEVSMIETRPSGCAKEFEFLLKISRIRCSFKSFKLTVLKNRWHWPFDPLHLQHISTPCDA